MTQKERKVYSLLVLLMIVLMLITMMISKRQIRLLEETKPKLGTIIIPLLSPADSHPQLIH